VEAFEQDVAEFRRLNGNADVNETSESRCRISNASANIAVVVTADFAGNAIRYRYEQESSNTAVPEAGVLTLRPSESSVELYSADQHLTAEQARQLILEPVLFPAHPTFKTSPAA
jgi:hypothetical protein